MKTYKIPVDVAVSLRRWLLATLVAATAFGAPAVVLRLGFLVPGASETLVISMAAAVAHLVFMTRAAWKLWEWPGLALWGCVMLALIILAPHAVGLSMLIDVVVFIFFYTRLGRQAGQPVAPPREVFEE